MNPIPRLSVFPHFRLWLAALVCLCGTALSQVPSFPEQRSYLVPGDSISAQVALKSGDKLYWSMRLGRARGNAACELVFTSDVAGVIWKLQFGADAAEKRDEEIKITQDAVYRLALRSVSEAGRVADLSAWVDVSAQNMTPFPIAETMRAAEKFSPGDRLLVEYEFQLSDTTRLTNLRALSLPADMVKLWAVTPSGDTVRSKSTVKRWLGLRNVFTLGDRSPHGARISLTLDLEIGESGDVTFYREAGSAPPEWLPKKARLIITHIHNPWSAVVVPPYAAWRQTKLSQGPEIAKAKYAAMSLRAGGLDSSLVSTLAAIYSERDSLAAERFARMQTIVDQDTTVLHSAHAFSMPPTHAGISVPLAGRLGKADLKKKKLSWFVEGSAEALKKSTVHEWRFDESRIAYPQAPQEFFWEPERAALAPAIQVHGPALRDKPQSDQLSLPTSDAEPFVRNGVTFVDESRKWITLYLHNLSVDTLYLVYASPVVVEHTVGKQFSRWPLIARILLIAFAVLGGGVVVAIVVLRKNERKRRELAEEMARELESARQTQLKLLPAGPLNTKGLEIFGLHQSMLLVGGDYYDFFSLEDGSVMLCVADVAGHGLSAALLMSNVQATLRAVAQPGRALNEIVALINREMFQRTSPDRFVTLLLAKISADRSLLTVCSAGHNPGYIVRPSGSIVELDAGGIMLGIMDVFPYIQMEYELVSGDLIALYTDGIPEAVVGEEDMFGYDRFKYFLANNRDARLADIAQSLFWKITPAEDEAIGDDMAIVLVRVKSKD